MDWTTVFIHIPKTAGTSVRLLFEGNCPPERMLRVYPVRRTRNITRDDLIAMPAEALAGIDVVFGHLPFGIHRRLPRPCRYVTVIRHPVERVLSHYYHHVRRVALGKATDIPLDRAVADGLSLEAFARGDIPGFESSRAAPPSRNLMTRLLSDRFPEGPRGPDDPALLEEAKRNIAGHFLMVGLTERLPEFIELIARQLHWAGGSPLPRALANPGRPTAESLDPETIDLIRRHNQLDLALYEHVAGLTRGGTRLAPGVGGRRFFGRRP